MINIASVEEEPGVSVLEELKSIPSEIYTRLLGIIEREDFNLEDNEAWMHLVYLLYFHRLFKQDYIAEKFEVTQAMVSRWGRGDQVLPHAYRERYLEEIKIMLREKIPQKKAA
tara:strand:+ start:146119 stop:146457 length:339 start_codon:yes stop_codon:yes gene_type:complete